MTTLDAASKAAELPASRDDATGVRGPMPQQAASGSHGYAIYPQKFVRLVGCRQSSATQGDVVPLLQRSAA